VCLVELFSSGAKSVARDERPGKLIDSNAVKRLFLFFEGGGVGPEIVDFGPHPGPTRSRGGLGKDPAGAPLDLHRFSAR
jgi:hypothetical protein